MHIVIFLPILLIYIVVLCRCRLYAVKSAMLQSAPILFLFCMVAEPVNGQVSQTVTDTVGVRIYYRQGHTAVEPTFRDNGMRLEAFVSRVLELQRDSSAHITGVDIVAYASPEGSQQTNERLARKRAAKIAEYLDGRLPSVSDRMYSVNASGINWSGLEDMVAASDMQYRAEVLDILRDEPETTYGSDGRLTGSRLHSLKNLRGGRPYQYMYRHFFPLLRNVDTQVICRYERRLPEPAATTPAEPAPLPDPEIAPEPRPRMSVPEPEPECTAAPVAAPQTAATDTGWQRHAYVKTNMPAWLALWTNVAGEIDAAPHWSANLSVYYSGFNYFKRTLKFRTLAVMPEMRYWPRACNDGFFVGAHVGMIYYNVALDGDKRYQDHKGRTPALGGGVSAGYRFALPRNPRWKFEASVGAGIYRLDYDVFDNVHNGLQTDRRRRTFYGVDNLAFSVCYTFDINRKGGQVR